MNNKKGFTMIELLATVTILGIISVIAIGSVTYLLNHGKDNYYKTQRNNLVSSAKAYYSANKELLPRTEGTSTEVTLEKLQETKYIGKVYDARHEECKKEVIGGKTVDTKVVVTKVSKNNYKYTSYLHCPSVSDDTTSESGSLSISIDSVSKSGNNYTYKIKSNSSTIIKNYTYTVFKNNSNYIGPISDKVSGSSVTLKSFTIDAEEFKKNNTFKITITAVDDKGHTASVTDNIYLKDNHAPTVTYLGSNVTEWKKPGTQKFEFSCVDELDPGVSADNQYISGCQREHYTVILNANNFKDDEYKEVTFSDKAGNTTDPFDLRPYIRLDNEPPTLPTLTGYRKTSSTNLSPSTKGSLTTLATDTWISAWAYTQVTGSVDVGFGEQNQGSKELYYEIKIDSGSWAKDNNTTYGGKLYSYKNVNAEGVTTVSYRTCDKLGNCNAGVSFKAKLDRSNPTCTVSKSHTDTTDGVTLEFTCSDSPTTVTNSGVKSSTCPAKQTKVKSTWSTTLYDNTSENTDSCYKEVTATTKYKRRYRTWNTCLTGDPNECVSGKVEQTCNGFYERGANSGEKCGPKTNCGLGASCVSCQYDCSYTDPCKTTKNTCEAGWNSWGSWSGYSTSNYCSSSDEREGSCEDSSATFYS